MEGELSLMAEKGKKVTKEEQKHIRNQVKELKSSNAALQAEIDMFERFISSMDAQDLLPHAGADDQGAAGAFQLDGGGRGRRLRSNTSDCLQQLTLEQKLYVAHNVLQLRPLDQEKLQKRNAQIHDKYKASLEEANVRIAEIRIERNKFERRLPSMKDMMKEPEKVVQHIQDKAKITKLEQLNLKIQALMMQEKKLQQQLSQKKQQEVPEYKCIFKEYGEQKPVENLDELEVKNLKVHRVLSSHKEQLQKVTLESTELSSDITNRRQMLAKIEEEIKHAEEGCSKVKAFNQHMCCQIADYQAPDITEYIRLKDKDQKLKQSLHTWGRKTRVTEMALKSRSKGCSTQRASGVEAGAQHIPTKLPHIAEHRS